MMECLPTGGWFTPTGMAYLYNVDIHSISSPLHSRNISEWWKLTETIVVRNIFESLNCPGFPCIFLLYGNHNEFAISLNMHSFLYSYITEDIDYQDCISYIYGVLK